MSAKGADELARQEGHASTTQAGPRDHAEPSPVAIAVIDSHTHIIRYANLAFRLLCSARVIEGVPIVGHGVAQALPSAIVEHLADVLRQVSESGPRSNVEIAPAGSDGARQSWDVTVSPIADRSGHPTDIVLELRDVTDAVDARRRWAETVEELREVNDRLLHAALREQDLREKAQAASDAKSAFLATMSHELRTPLTAIIGYEELLADAVTGPVTDAQRVQLRSIKRSAEHLLELIDELLTLAQIEARREEIRRRPVQVDAWLDEAAVLVAPLAGAKGLAFTVVRGERPITIDSDPLKVRQILVNLLGNAVKFTELGEITLMARANGDSVLVEVRDTGIGISAENLARVFDPFWQADPSPTRKNQGSGLGLAVSRHLARLLGGDLTVESVLGRGSTFTLQLPIDAIREGKD